MADAFTGWRFWRGREAMLKTDSAQARAVRGTLEFIRKSAVRQTPVDTGDLQRSSFVKMAKGGVASGIVAMGGGRGTRKKRVWYAIIVHQRPARHAPGTNHEFLKRPFDRDAEPTYNTLLRVEMAREGF